MTTKRVLIDTNMVIDLPELLLGRNIVVPSHVLREIEKLELKKSDQRLQESITRAKQILEKHKDKIYVDVKDYTSRIEGLDAQYTDNVLLQICIDNSFAMLTADTLLRRKCELYGVELAIPEVEEDAYTGYKEVYMTDSEYKDFYQNDLNNNKFGLLVNEYLIILDDITGKDIDGLLWDGQVFQAVSKRGFKTDLLGDFKPHDYYQACLMDSMRRNKITMASGKAGSGKTLATFSYSAQQLEKGKIKCIICFVNTVPVKGAQQLGFYKGTKDEKLLDASIGSMLGSKFGSKFIVEQMIAKEELILLPMVDIRGFDSTGMNAHIHILEAQNADKELMRLSVQRVGEDCKLFIDGDYEQQVDNRAFEGRNNGMRRVSEVFRGRDCYGQVRLPKVLRSEIAAIADLM